MDKNMMLVLVGQRRVGKSYILLDLKNWIEQNKPASNIVYLDNYQDALRSLYAEQRCQIIITGSNAYIYSSELGTRLGGRYIE